MSDELEAFLRAAACCPLSNVDQLLRSASPWTQTPGQVDVLDGCALSEAAFLVQYLLPGRPVLLRGLTDRWRAKRDFVSADGPDLDALSSSFPSSPVQVADCSLPEEAPRLLGWTLSAYCSYLAAHCGAADPRCLYLKDWHARAEAEAAGDAPLYETPHLFQEDWLNGFYDSKGAPGCCAAVRDYRFVYLGPPGSSTPLHSDVLRSFSWSANLCGVKRWRLFPPRGGDAMELLQAAGETLFVPSGWAHTVENTGLVPVLSVNHNWLNDSSLDIVWTFLQEELRGAAAAIDDCRALVSAHEFDLLLARNVRANAGLDLGQFAHLVWGAVRGRHCDVLSGGEAGLVGARAALAVRRAACVLRELAGQRAALLGAAPAGAWADALDALLLRRGYPASTERAGLAS